MAATAYYILIIKGFTINFNCVLPQQNLSEISIKLYTFRKHVVDINLCISLFRLDDMFTQSEKYYFENV